MSELKDMTERKYSVSEIERMRWALTQIVIQEGVPFYRDEAERRIELQLQTYMLNGNRPPGTL